MHQFQFQCSLGFHRCRVWLVWSYLRKNKDTRKTKKLAVVKFEGDFEIAEICLHSKMQNVFLKNTIALKLKVELSKTFRSNRTKYTRTVVLYVTELKCIKDL